MPSRDKHIALKEPGLVFQGISTSVDIIQICDR